MKNPSTENPESNYLGRTLLPEGHEEVHRFAFELQYGSAALPVRESGSLRTARVVVAHLQDGNALIQMFRAIVSSDPASQNTLHALTVGRSGVRRIKGTEAHAQELTQ
jgi:D-serine deaminase-like pyridoxal phosphate-dependent protein